MLRPYIATIGSILLSGCASVGLAPPADREVAVSLGLEDGSASAERMLSAMYTNVSNRPLCFRSDMFTNPGSTEVEFWVRDSRGRTVASNEIEGYIPEPQPGLRRLEAGSSGTAKYNLHFRLVLPPQAGNSHERLRARLRFQYYPCDADLRPGGAMIRDLVFGESGWQPI